MTERDDLLLERYFKQELSPEERIAFEARLEQDSELAATYELHVSMKSFLREKNKQAQFANFLEDVSASYFKEKQTVVGETKDTIVPIWKRPTFIGSILAVAAAIAGVLLFPFLINSNLYEQFNEHRPLALVEQSSNTNETLVTAERAFNAGDFQSALIALTQYLNTNPNDTEARLYKGISLLELDQTVEAATIFQAIANGDSALQTEGLWYWALSDIKQGDNTTAKAKLKRLITENKDSKLSKQAERLLSKLD